jgi:hypothetical protein
MCVCVCVCVCVCAVPVQARFGHSSCPPSVLLDGKQNLTFVLNLVDGFGTVVRGEILGRSVIYNTTLTSPADSACQITPVGISAIYNNVGQLEFHGINIRGYNGNSCAIVFTTEASFAPQINITWVSGGGSGGVEQLATTIEIPPLVHPVLTCNTTLRGCGPKQQIVHQDGYDDCETRMCESARERDRERALASWFVHH